MWEYFTFLWKIEMEEGELVLFSLNSKLLSAYSVKFVAWERVNINYVITCMLKCIIEMHLTPISQSMTRMLISKKYGGREKLIFFFFHLYFQVFLFLPVYLCPPFFVSFSYLNFYKKKCVT